MTDFFDDTYFMKEALKEARKAYHKDEVPIGTIITHNQRIIAKAHNLTESLNDVTAHAEIQAITAAQNYSGGKFLQKCSLYVTMEPCIMCAGAIYWSQLGRLVYGTTDPERGFTQFTPSVIHPKTEVTAQLMEKESKDLVRKFFRTKRKN